MFVPIRFFECHSPVNKALYKMFGLGGIETKLTLLDGIKKSYHCYKEKK